MGLLIKTFPDGSVAIAPTRVYCAEYQLFTANYSTPGHIQDGWYYVTDTEVESKLAKPWVQPTGAHDAYTIGDIVAYKNARWRSTIINNVWEPGVSGWSSAESDIPTWVQPTGAHDAYSKGAVVRLAGDIWASLVDANVWEPGVSGWRLSHILPPSSIVPVPAWVQPTGAHDAYPLGAKVSHNGKNWTSTIDANVWEPGIFGWVEY